MLDKQDLNKLVDYIEENLRTSPYAGIKFIDPKNFKNRILNRQNHIIFGRRGAGKSTLIASLVENSELTSILINVEDFKQISYPNVIIHVLRSTLDQIIDQVKQQLSYFVNPINKFSLLKELKHLRKELNNSLLEPDLYEEEIRA